jgi:hypothetical protein
VNRKKSYYFNVRLVVNVHNRAQKIGDGAKDWLSTWAYSPAGTAEHLTLFHSTFCGLRLNQKPLLPCDHFLPC